MLPEFYNQLGAMHGTIMVFLGVVPLAVGGFGNYVVPLQIGAPDMAFPRLNMASYQVFFLGGVIMLAQLLRPGRRGAVAAGPPTRRSPTSSPTGQTLWLVGMVFLITSSLLGAVNFIATIIQLRAPGLTSGGCRSSSGRSSSPRSCCCSPSRRCEAAGVMQLMDRVAGTSFFLPQRAGGDRARRSPSPAAATRCSGSTSSGSSPTPRSTC